MTPGAPVEAAPELRALRWRLLALLVAIGVGVAGLEALQSSLIRKSGREIEAVNTATRHHLLSQQIVKAAAMLEHANHAEDAAVGEPF